MAFCGSCGHEVKPGARFCFNCGEQSSSATSTPPSTAAALGVTAAGSIPAYPAGVPAYPGTQPAYAQASPVARPVEFSANKGRAIFVYAGLVLTILVSVAMISAVSTQIDQLEQVQAIESGRPGQGDVLTLLAEVEENDDTIAAVNATTILIFLGTATAFAFWTHRSYKNLVALQAGPLPATVAFAVWSVLIPVANVYLGFLRLKEIWQASSLQGVRSALTGVNWKSVAVPWFITAWWWGFGALIIARFVLGLSKPDTETSAGIDSLKSYDSVVIVLGGAAIILCALGIYAVMQITKRQNEAYALLQAPPAYDAPYQQPVASV
jgi:hypothetical protein